jgi:hypothetical protein
MIDMIWRCYADAYLHYSNDKNQHISRRRLVTLAAEGIITSQQQ